MKKLVIAIVVATVAISVYLLTRQVPISESISNSDHAKAGLVNSSPPSVAGVTKDKNKDHKSTSKKAHLEVEKVISETEVSEVIESGHLENSRNEVLAEMGSFIQGSPSSENIRSLVEQAELGDSGSLIVLNSFYSACFFGDFLNPKCKNLEEQMGGFNPFLELEKKAIAGDKFSRLNYWPELIRAAASKLINPLANEYEWGQRKERGINWLVGFSKGEVRQLPVILQLLIGRAML